MRTLAIGDIHGCSVALDALLDAVAPTADDLIVTLGDYVDGGPDSSGVLDRLVALHRGGRLVALRGNHEQMMIGARDNPGALKGWLACGGQATLTSYARRGGTLAAVPDEHWHFLDSVCRNWAESESHLFAHAAVHAELPMEEQPEWVLLWESVHGVGRHISGKILVCGHTRQHNGLPLDLGHALCIDTSASKGGWLTCLDVEARRVWQADQFGRRRGFWLDDGP